MDLANKFNSYDNKKAEARTQNPFNKKRDATIGGRKEDPAAKLAKMKNQAIRSIDQTNWMFRTGLGPQDFFGTKPDFKSDSLRFP